MLTNRFFPLQPIFWSVGFFWIFLDIFGYSWIFLDILGYFWIFLDILGYSWIFCVRARFCARDFVRARFCARATMGERPAKNQKIAKKYIYRYPIKFFFYKKLRLDASKRMRTILNPSETHRCPNMPKNQNRGFCFGPLINFREFGMGFALH